MYLTSRARFTHPVEELRLQNIWLGSERERQVSSLHERGLLSDMAGNAMEGMCCVATILTSLLMLSFGTSAGSLVAYGLGPPPEVETDEPAVELDDDLVSVWPAMSSRIGLASDVFLAWPFWLESWGLLMTSWGMGRLRHSVGVLGPLGFLERGTVRSNGGESSAGCSDTGVGEWVRSCKWCREPDVQGVETTDTRPSSGHPPPQVML